MPQTTRKKRTNGKKKRIEYWVCCAILASLTLFLGLLAWLSPAFCDWYARYILPIWLNVFGRITSLFPFSVGEWMVVLGILLLLAAALLCIPYFILRKNKKAVSFRRGCEYFYRIVLAIVLDVALIMMLNCLILYHCSPLDANPTEEKKESYSVDELEILRNYIVEQCNYYSERMERDENGYVVYHGDMEATAVAAMNALGARFPRLDGYYPNIKPLFFSDFVSQMYICGYYFPFSLEANVNSNMYITNYPSTMCHELAHTRGYIYEDEANFFGFLACVDSGDEFFAYSGYLNVLYYVVDSYTESIAEIDWERMIAQPTWYEAVATDTRFLLPETWEKIEEDAIISTDTVDAVSDAVTDLSLKVNGVSDGIASYSRVVELLLEYYDGILY